MVWLLASSAFGPAALAQRVLDGDIVTRFSGTRNYIANPNAQYDTRNVTLANATAVRSTTTPIGEGGTEYNVTITSANGTIDFVTSGATADNLGSANCEATADVRGFQGSTKIQVFDGTTVLYTDTFGLKATRTKVGFLGFPCPSDPSTLRIRITDTATLAATNEIGSIYLGRARNFGDAVHSSVMTAYTAAVTGTVSGTYQTGYPVAFWRRQGDHAHITISARAALAGSGATGLGFSIPPGLTMDTTKFVTLGAGDENFGEAGVYTGTAFTTGTVSRKPGSTTEVSILEPGTAGFFTGADWVANSQWSLNFSVPIATWSVASSAVSPSLAAPEYASNSAGDQDSDNTTSFTNSVNGELIPRASLTGNRIRRVQFAQAILPTDKVYFEIRDTSGRWIPTAGTYLSPNGSNGLVQLAFQGSLGYGAGIEGYASSTQVNVLFGQYRSFGATYASAGGPWSAFSGNDIRWRVTKEPGIVPGAIYVRSPVKANLTATAPGVGDVDQEVIARRTTIYNSGAATAGTYYDVTSLAITLDPGCWDIDVKNVNYTEQGAAGIASAVTALRTGSTVLEEAASDSGVVGSSSTATHSFVKRVNISTSTTYKVSQKYNISSGTPVVSGVYSRGDIVTGGVYIRGKRCNDL